MIDRKKEMFKNHIATLHDYGNIKVLDFKNPESSENRIRFIFEEDYYKLHISGNLGELTATNAYNMVYDKFKDFVNAIGYFEEKIDCHSRPLYVWKEEEARKEIVEYLEEEEMLSEIDDVEAFLDSALADFDMHSGIGIEGYKVLSEVLDDIPVETFGKERTGILELYMLAFKMAQEQLESVPICSYEKCMICHCSDCMTGQVAREQGKDAFETFVKEMGECEVLDE